jgi:formylglycine-generating enzyme required for sulfatase activity
MSSKFALIIGNTEYTDTGLAQLTAPGKDVEDFVRVLNDQNVCAFDDVKVLLNQPEYIVRRGIDIFFDQKKPDDLLILYFSGHGIRDELGTLYLAVKNTIRTRLRSTAIKSDYIREAMDQSRSKRQVLILDCCNSGAYAQGTKAATGVSIGTKSAFEGTGYGHVVLTASDSMQFAWEGDKVIGKTQNSLFTHFLIEGLKGEADHDGDGRITVDDLYDYAYEQVKLATPKQTPSKFSSKQQGEIVLRQTTRIEEIKPIPLPVYLSQAIENPDSDIRSGAVQSLTKLLTGKNIGLARSAKEALERMAKSDDSRRVSQAATQALRLAGIAAQEAKENERLSKKGMPRQKPQSKKSMWVKPIIIAGSVLFLSFCAIASSSIWTPFIPSSILAPLIKQTNIVPAIQTDVIQSEISAPPTFTSTPLLASTSEPTQNIPTIVISIVPTNTEVATLPSSTLDINCASAPKRLHLGIDAQVVTKPNPDNNLRLRRVPEASAEIVERLAFGTIVTVINGPKCGFYDSGYFWWWEVQTQQSKETGWVVEGSDDVDEIFIRPKTGTQVLNEKDGATLIYIPPGKFKMGLTEEQKNELLQLCTSKYCRDLYEAAVLGKEVELTKGYWIYRTEVSNGQYAKCIDVGIDVGGCTPPANNSFDDNFADHPVVRIIWDQAVTYCQWAGGRLPTSAEWEMAASWNETSQEKYIYPWGNFFDGTLLNFCDKNCSDAESDKNVDDGHAGIAPVESYPGGASPYGVLNMAGNVWEWVSDFYSPTYYLTNTNWVNPRGTDGPDDKSLRVVRGGSAWYSRAYSNAVVPDNENPHPLNAQDYFGLGFRCVIDQP